MKTKHSNRAFISATTLVASALSFQALASETTDHASKDKTFSGVVTTVTQPDHTVSVKGWMSTKQFNLGDACAITLPDQTGGAVGDLRPGESVVVHYQNAHGVLIADRIEQKAMQMEGRVVRIDPDLRTLTLHRDGSDKTLELADKCQVVLRGNAPGTYANIEPGSLVTVTYETPGKSKIVREIQQTSLNFSGDVTAIDLNTHTVKAKTLLDSKQFHLADNCVIVVNGNMNGKLADLRPNEHLVFSYDEVNGVDVVNRIAADQDAKTVNTAQQPRYNNNNNTNGEVGFAPPLP